MTHSSETSGDSARLTNDELFEILTSRMRRIVLLHLHQQGAATLNELVDIIRAYTDTRANVGGDDPDRVAMALANHQLPRLERLNLITYDRLHGTVNLDDIPDDFVVLLNIAFRRELRWAETFEGGRHERERE